MVECGFKKMNWNNTRKLEKWETRLPQERIELFQKKLCLICEKKITDAPIDLLGICLECESNPKLSHILNDYY